MGFRLTRPPGRVRTGQCWAPPPWEPLPDTPVPPVTGRERGDELRSGQARDHLSGASGSSSTMGHFVRKQAHALPFVHRQRWWEQHRAFHPHAGHLLRARLLGSFLEGLYFPGGGVRSSLCHPPPGADCFHPTENCHLDTFLFCLFAPGMWSAADVSLMTCEMGTSRWAPDLGADCSSFTSFFHLWPHRTMRNRSADGSLPGAATPGERSFSPSPDRMTFAQRLKTHSFIKFRKLSSILTL